MSERREPFARSQSSWPRLPYRHMAVLLSFQVGCGTVAALSRETGLPQPAVEFILADLEQGCWLHVEGERVGRYPVLTRG